MVIVLVKVCYWVHKFIAVVMYCLPYPGCYSNKIKTQLCMYCRKEDLWTRVSGREICWPLML